MAKSMMQTMLSVFFLFLTAVISLIGRFAPTFVEYVYMPLSQAAMKFLAGTLSVFPVAVWEIVAVALVVWALYSLVRNFVEMKLLQWCTGLLLAVSFGFFAFMVLWGMNYYAPSIQERLDIPEREYSVQELRRATEYYRDMANKTASSVNRDQDGAMVSASFNKQAENAADGYKILEIRTEEFTGPKAQPKRLLSGGLFTFGGEQGIFVPFTGESCVSGETYCAVLPFAMCNQMGKRMGFARNTEAEFAAFLACSAHESPEFVYSGYFMAFSYCYNALYARDRNAAVQVWQGVGRELRADCLGRIEYEMGHENQAVVQVKEDLAKSYQQLLRDKMGTKTMVSVSQLLTMWYYEGIL